MKFRTCLTTVIASYVVGNVAIGKPIDGELEDESRAAIEIAEVRNGKVLLRFIGDTARPPVVWASSDLRTWEKIGSAVETTSGEFLAVDGAAVVGAGARFYRAGYEGAVEDTRSTSIGTLEEISEASEQDNRTVDDGVIRTFSWTQTSGPITDDVGGSGAQSRAQGEPDVPCVEVSDSTNTTSGNDVSGAVHGVVSSKTHGHVHFVKACSEVKTEGKPRVLLP